MLRVHSRRQYEGFLLGSVLLSLQTGCTNPTNHLITEYVTALNSTSAGDIEAFLAKWADDLEHTVSQATLRSKQDLREFFKSWTQIFAEWKYKEVRRIVGQDIAAWEGVAQGIHKATGKTVEFPLVIILEFDSRGKAKMAHIYFDTGVIQHQLAEYP